MTLTATAIRSEAPLRSCGKPERGPNALVDIPMAESGGPFGL